MIFILYIVPFLITWVCIVLIMDKSEIKTEGMLPLLLASLIPGINIILALGGCLTVMEDIGSCQ